MRFAFVGTEEHFADHLRPVFGGLDEDERGDFITERPKSPEVRIADGDVVIVASWGDYKRVQRCGRPIVWFEHGAGFSYPATTKHGSYAGGGGRGRAAMFPAVNRWVADRNLASYPEIPSPIVGCPKLDRLVQMNQPMGGVVAISWHWDCHLFPEVRSALRHYQKVLPDLKTRFGSQLIGHAHPRAWWMVEGLYRQLGIEPVRSFEEVCRRASVYVCDTSSTIFEFAALDRPVVLMNAPWYRREISNGLRFWDHAGVGVQVNQPGDLIRGIERALLDEPAIRERRHAAVADVFPFLGEAVDRTISVLRDRFAGRPSEPVLASAPGSASGP